MGTGYWMPIVWGLPISQAESCARPSSAVLSLLRSQLISSWLSHSKDDKGSIVCPLTVASSHSPPVQPYEANITYLPVPRAVTCATTSGHV
jgi:hypothetical protein